MKHTIEIPQSLKDINLDSLIKFSKVDKENEHELTIKAFDLFCNTPYKVLRALPITFVNETLAKLNEVLNSEYPDRVTFEMNGVKYGRIPNILKSEFGEYSDMDTFITPTFEGEIKHEDAFRFMATIYRPIKEEVKGLYSIVDYDEEYIKQDHWIKFKENCPADLYINSVGFFLDLKNELQKVLKYSLPLLEKELQKQGNSSELIGVGMAAYTAMLNQQVEPLKRAAKIMFLLPCLTFPTKQTAENLRTMNEEIKQ